MVMDYVNFGVWGVSVMIGVCFDLIWYRYINWLGLLFVLFWLLGVLISVKVLNYFVVS